MNPSLPPFQQARVLVYGDVMLDRYYQGDTARISPEAPVPVVKVTGSTEKPGGAGNVALNIAALGAHVSLAGFVGDDAAADSVETLLGAAGVDCTLSRVPGRETITKLRVLSRRQQLIRLDFEDVADASHPAMPVSVAQQLEQCDVLVLSDYAKGALADPQPLMALARRHAVPVLVDPKGPDFDVYRGSALLTPNLVEFEAAVGPCRNEDELAARGQALIAELELGGLLITRGDQGMTLLLPGAAAQHLPARAREVFDVTGAGDTVIAVVAAALAAGSPLAEAVTCANVAAGLVVGRLGTASVSAPELQQALGGERGLERGVLAAEQLALAVEQARAAGEKLVFTNGCFDILHAGHVACLQEARRLGDRLIVAVNSDDSVRRLKGAGRPVNPLARRMAVLAGLASVDWVVGFDEDTPENLLRELRPDVLAKGGDYRSIEDVVGWQLVQSWGGEVRLTGHQPAASTTAIVDRIRDDSKG
ncbi:MAG: bifunctional D-glycero-beta-D-manno-heptose-7-phosphate kinase/D-glycero-beta-D-manno-heptose 1-phosphate adenylyltransferase HldE [Halioglobus sp.]